MKPSPWPLDGIKAFTDVESQSQITRPGLIEPYLSVGSHEDKFFLIGSKGLGKTTLLSYKSYLYHEQLGGACKFNTSIDELTEKLDIHAKTFSREELLQFRSINDWETLWKLTLWVLIFKVYGLEINPELDRIISKNSRLSTIFSELLTNRRRISSFPQFINELIEKSKLIKSSVAIFIDDVDQAFEQSILNNEHYAAYHHEDEQNPAVRIWINGQNALIGAIYSIHRQNRHIKIFATIRTEAFRCLKAQLVPNFQHHSVLLEYDKPDIEEIFSKNIRLIPANQLAFAEGKTPIEQFLGFGSEINHRFAVDYQNNPRKESPFDFIYRHTYGRPREIVQMGKELHGLITQKNYKELSHHDKIERIRAKATQFADKLFAEYRQQIIPNFDQQRLMNFIRAIPGNVIPREEFAKLDVQTTRLYYSLGLLGYVREEPNGKRIQIFLPAAEYNYAELDEIPDSEYYIVHPTLDQVLLQHHSYVDFYYKHCIIGNGRVFYSPQEDIPEEKDFYFPKLLAGHDGRIPTEGNTFAIREYYEFFFNAESNPKFQRIYLTEAGAAKRILTKVARISYYSRLNKIFGRAYDPRIRDLKQELEEFGIERPYYAVMNEDSMPDSRNKFKDKLFGRIIVAAAILYLDLNFSAVKKLMQTGEINFKAKEDAEAVYQYLRRCFFIPGLGRNQSLSNDYKSPKNKEAKQAIFMSLSPYEQRTLIHLRQIVIEEIDMLDNLFEKKEHAAWVQTNILEKIWRND